MDEELHQVCRALLDIEALVKLLHDLFKFFFRNIIDFALKDNLDYFLVQGFLLDVLSNKGVKWISQLMGHSGINHHEQIRMRLLLVILNFRRNILDLKHKRILVISLHFGLLDSDKFILSNDFESVILEFFLIELEKQIKNAEFSS